MEMWHTDAAGEECVFCIFYDKMESEAEPLQFLLGLPLFEGRGALGWQVKGGRQGGGFFELIFWVIIVIIVIVFC